MLCMIMEVSIDILDTPADRLPCLWRSSICECKKKRRTWSISVLFRLFKEHIHADRLHTFEASCSTLSATFPTDNRISVLCCLASVIKKEVTSLEPAEKKYCKSFSTYIKCKTVLQLCRLINYQDCCCRTAIETINNAMFLVSITVVHKKCNYRAKQRHFLVLVENGSIFNMSGSGFMQSEGVMNKKELLDEELQAQFSLSLNQMYCQLGYLLFALTTSPRPPSCCQLWLALAPLMHGVDRL